MIEKELWLAREEAPAGDYAIFVGEPTPSDMYMFASHLTAEDIKSGEKGIADYFCSGIFHLIVPGTRICKGRKKRIKRILIELED